MSLGNIKQPLKTRLTVFYCLKRIVKQEKCYYNMSQRQRILNSSLWENGGVAAHLDMDAFIASAG